MALKSRKKTGINWTAKKRQHDSFQKLELSDVIDKVTSTLIYNKKKVEKTPKSRH